ncbi:hypothetical protein D3C87_1478360 [compost metagenome]
MISQIDFDFIRVAAATGDIGPGNVIHLLQPRRAFGQRHQFLLQLRRIGGVRVSFVGEYLDAHVIEQLRTGVGTLHGRDGHGEQFFPQVAVDVYRIKHAPDAL